jgi:hypothetical protein
VTLTKTSAGFSSAGRNGDGVARCDTGSYELEPLAPPVRPIPDAGIRGRAARHPEVALHCLSVALAQEHRQRRRHHPRRCRGAGSDYLAKNATLVFKPHQRTKTFTIGVIGDHKREKNETFTVHLSMPKGARIANADATGTIVNDD